MKIAILVPMFLPKHLGGVEIATYNIASHLAKKGHQVHVITLWDSGLPEVGIEQGFTVHRIRLPRVKSIGVLIFWFRILLSLKKIDYDIIHVQSVTIALPAYLAGKFFKKPYLVCGHGFDLYFPWRFKKIISKLIMKNASAVIALTENMRKDMQKIYPREVLVIPNGIDGDKFAVLSNKEALRKKIGVNNSDKIIVFVGTLRPVKNVKSLVRAIPILIPEEPNIKLILVGGGSQVDYLRKMVKELHLEKSVSFTGEISNEKAISYLTAADIFVLPSLSEGFSIVSLEAMACGLPVIATKVGVLPEIIENGVNGFLIDSGEPKEIAEKVLQLLGSEDLREEISENNKRKAKDYNWTNIIQRLEEAYQNHL
jgi:glycosyltransferase involved in cell wall biosynthesis